MKWFARMEEVGMTGFMGHDRTYVIAEIGSNHGGLLDAALALIDAAAEAGADAAKFQAGHADHVYDPTQFPDEHASFRKYVEPVLGWLPQLAERCQRRGIDFGCSTFCLDALDAVDPYVKWHKVASIEATWAAFVTCVAQKGKPIIVSTGGMSGRPGFDVDRLLNRLNFERARDVVLMQCAVSYPCGLEDSDIWAMGYYGNPLGSGTFGFGLSDHTTHPTIAPCAAVALGASVIEKHIRPVVWKAPGWKSPPDIPHSIDPDEFRQMVDAIRLTELARGSSEKRIRESEKPYLKYRRGPRGLRGA